MSMFNNNQMRELQYLAADRYQRAGGGGAFKVYATSKAYYDAIGHNELSPWQRALIESTFRWRQSCEIAREHFRIACLTSNSGFYHGDDIPF